MSQIDDLLADLCPDGAEFRELREIFTIKGGYTPSKSDESAWTDGTVPWFRMEDLRANGGVLSDSLQHVHESAIKGGLLFPANSILIATSATIGEHALITVPHLSNQRFTSLALRPGYSDCFDMKFVYYYCFVLADWCRSNTTTSSFASVDMGGLKRFRFPVLPLDVQREIVRVLDTFSELEAELEAELKARRRQYEHYRDSLLAFGEGEVEWVTLGDIADVSWGDTSKTKRSYLTDHHGFIAYSATGPDGRLASYDYDRVGIVLSAIGARCGKTWLASGRWSCIKNTIRFFSFREDRVTNEYLYWATSRPTIWRRNGSTQPFITLSGARATPVPLPSIAEQRSIVAILNAFDALVNDLSIGLPAELAARRKQYEYYRDKLLTFKELAG